MTPTGPDGYFTVEEVAQALGLSAPRVRVLADRPDPRHQDGGRSAGDPRIDRAPNFTTRLQSSFNMLLSARLDLPATSHRLRNRGLD